MIKSLQLRLNIDQEEYKAVLADISCTDPHFYLPYLKNFGGGLDQLHCFIFETNCIKAIILSHITPIEINGVNMLLFDAASPYGYFGPRFKKTPSQQDVRIFWNSLVEWYLENNIVSDFVRFSLNGNESGYPGRLVPTMSNIKGVIREPEEQWSNFDRKVRKNVNRAIRENLKFKVFCGSLANDILDEFYSLYISTMERNSAARKFFYSKENFTELFQMGESTFAVAMVYSYGIAISTELVLCSDQCVYSFLGGTDENHFEKRPNDFLKFELINWARAKGLKYFILGGGYGKDDGIYNYKKSFFPEDSVTYYTGRAIIFKEKYLKLCQKLPSFTFNEDEVLEGATFFPHYKIKMEH
jgi:hypothetical protein